MKQPLGAQCSTQDETGLQTGNPEALQDLAVQISRQHRRYKPGINSWIWETKPHCTWSGNHSQAAENRGLIKDTILLAKLICQNQHRPGWRQEFFHNSYPPPWILTIISIINTFKVMSHYSPTEHRKNRLRNFKLTFSWGENNSNF